MPGGDRECVRDGDPRLEHRGAERAVLGFALQHVVGSATYVEQRADGEIDASQCDAERPIAGARRYGYEPDV
jgi:hypothetical protein